jgi:ABC-type nitrate/sulfonate/bicarbonate transport system substrate-binding protein
MWVGEAKGLFKKERVEPILTFTPNSVELAKNLHAGKFDIALTAIDNAVAYDEGQGEADLGGPANFVALFGIENGMLGILSVPEIKAVSELKGKRLSVDAPTTGFAFALYGMLERSGIKPSEVEIVRVGGGAQRLEALLKREQDGTLLNTPLDLVAEAKGFNRLLIATDVLGAYQGISGIARRDLAAKDRSRIVAFIRGFHASVNWLADPANRNEGVDLLTTRMKGMDRALAERAYERLLDPKTGIYRDLGIDQEGLKTVLRLRSTYAKPEKTLSDADRYLDLSYLKEALNK